MTATQLFLKNTETLKARYEGSENQKQFDISDALRDRLENYTGLTDIGYPNEEQARQFAGNFKELELDAIFFIVGMSDGKFIRELLKVTNETHTIIVYEPDMNSLLYVMQNMDISDVLEDKRVLLMVEGVNEHILFSVVTAFVFYNNFNKIKMGMLPGYNGYEHACEKVKKALEYRISMVQFDKITHIGLSKNVRVNLLHNIGRIIRERSVNQMFENTKPIDKKGVPAIIVSAGPSLDKNIDMLKNACGKAFIIVVDTALKAALRAGIKPDLTVCVDPRKEVIMFEHEEFCRIPAVFDPYIPYTIVKKHEGVEFYSGSGNYDLPNYFYEKYRGVEYEMLGSGGSVANTAFSIAVGMGFDTVILVGQDLAFTDGKGHTKDAYDDEKKNHDDAANSPNLCEVPDIYGGMVMTEARMKSYIEWFELEFEAFPQIKVIDATEGGALIRGTTIMTLEDAINEECHGDVSAILEAMNGVEPLYLESEQEEIKEYLNNIGYELEELEMEFQSGIRAYERLKGGLKSGNQTVIKMAMNTIRHVNELEGNHPLISLIKLYIMDDSYQAMEKLSEDGDDNSAVINTGIALFDSYLKGIESLKKALDKMD